MARLPGDLLFTLCVLIRHAHNASKSLGHEFIPVSSYKATATANFKDY